MAAIRTQEQRAMSCPCLSARRSQLVSTDTKHTGKGETVGYHQNLREIQAGRKTRE